MEKPARTVPVRLNGDEAERLDVMAKRAGLPRSTALRALARFALEHIDGDPSRLFAAPRPAVRGAR